MQSASPHRLAFDGNIQALHLLPPDERFQILSERDHTVLYSACRSPKTSAQIVSFLIDSKGCQLHQPNGPSAAASFPQHAVVQTLSDVLQGKATADPAVLLEVLHVLKSKGANMGAINAHKKTALQEFQMFSSLMAGSPFSHLVQNFMHILSHATAYPPPVSPPTPLYSSTPLSPPAGAIVSPIAGYGQ
jgi:hypothetical protein